MHFLNSFSKSEKNIKSRSPFILYLLWCDDNAPDEVNFKTNVDDEPLWNAYNDHHTVRNYKELACMFIAILKFLL